MTEKKKVKLKGGNGGKEVKTMIDIRIRVLNNGKIEIDAPKNLALFHEVVSQAARVMRETYPDQLPPEEKKEGKVIELNPKIVIAQK